MSQNPRTTGVALSDTDPALDRALILLKEAEEFENMGPDVQQGERMSSQWRKDAIRRILSRLRVTTSSLNRDINHPEGIRVLSGKSRSEYPESERLDLVHKVGLLKRSCDIVREDVEELSDLYVRREDSPNIVEVVVLLMRRTEVLKSALKRF